MDLFNLSISFIIYHPFRYILIIKSKYLIIFESNIQNSSYYFTSCFLLLSPLLNTQNSVGVAYLDHAAATLYSELQMEAVFKDLTANIYGNPRILQLKNSSPLSNFMNLIIFFFEKTWI